MSKWFCYRQNNSGGSFCHDPEAGVGIVVFIEANNADQASARAQDIGIYFDGVREGRDCECCGDRWNEPWHDDGDDVPMLYGEEWRAIEPGEDPEMDWGLPSYIHPLEGPFRVGRKV